MSANEKQVGGTHYKNGDIPDHWDIVEALGWNYRIGNATKYLWRLGKKGGPEKAIEDLEKSIHYLQKELEVRKNTLATQELLTKEVKTLRQIEDAEAEEEAMIAAERAAAWKPNYFAHKE